MRKYPPTKKKKKKKYIYIYIDIDKNKSRNSSCELLKKNHDAHTLGSVCAKYESVWSKFCEIVLVTKCTLGLYVQYVQAGLGLHKDPQLV